MRGSHAYVVLALALAVLTAAVVGRLSAPRGEATPTATSERPARLPAWQGTRVVAGVRVGYSRTRAGAVAAMAAHGQALADPRVKLDDRRGWRWPAGWAPSVMRGRWKVRGPCSLRAGRVPSARRCVRVRAPCFLVCPWPFG